MAGAECRGLPCIEPDCGYTGVSRWSRVQYTSVNLLYLSILLVQGLELAAQLFITECNLNGQLQTRAEILIVILCPYAWVCSPGLQMQDMMTSSGITLLLHHCEQILCFQNSCQWPGPRACFHAITQLDVLYKSESRSVALQVKRSALAA